MALITTDNLNTGSFYVTDNRTKFGTLTDNDYNTFGYFLNGINVTNAALDTFNPYIQGVSRLFMIRHPLFMTKKFPKLSTKFKSLLETGYTRIDGINDVTAEFVDFEGGFAGQKFSNVSLVRDETDTISISLYEQSGSPVRHYIETWMTGVRDPRSGIATYHAIDFKDVAYSEKNHNAELLYVTMDPTGKKLEYACMLAKVFPTKVPKSHLNYEKGNRSEVLMDLEFRCTKYESPYINDLAATFLTKDDIKYSYLNFNPNDDTGGADTYEKLIESEYKLTLPTKKDIQPK